MTTDRPTETRCRLNQRPGGLKGRGRFREPGPRKHRRPKAEARSAGPGTGTGLALSAIRCPKRILNHQRKIRSLLRHRVEDAVDELACGHVALDEREGVLGVDFPGERPVVGTGDGPVEAVGVPAVAELPAEAAAGEPDLVPPLGGVGDVRRLVDERDDAVRLRELLDRDVELRVEALAVAVERLLGRSPAPPVAVVVAAATSEAGGGTAAAGTASGAT